MDGASITGLYQEFLIPSITLFQINVISAMPPLTATTGGNIWSCYVSYGYVSYACVTNVNVWNTTKCNWNISTIHESEVHRTKMGYR